MSCRSGEGEPMPIQKEIVADDGLHRAVRTTVSLRRPGRASKAEQNAIRALITESGRRATFEGAIGAAEKFWKGVSTDPHAKPLSKSWYATKILPEIDRLRRVVALPETEKLTPSLEFQIVSAVNLGSTIEEARWRFGIGDAARLGVRTRRKNRENARKGVRLRADTKRRDDQRLIAAVRAYRETHPSHSRRTMAKNLLPDFGRPGDHRKALDALAKRIGRLEK